MCAFVGKRLYGEYSPRRLVAQLLPVLVCMGIDGVWIMLDPGVPLLGPCRFFYFLAQRTVGLLACAAEFRVR
jgi:hypothetical protein